MSQPPEQQTLDPQAAIEDADQTLAFLKADIQQARKTRRELKKISKPCARPGRG